MIRTPPAAIAARYAEDWQAIGMHEAGHVVYGLAAGAPITGVWIAYDRSLFGGWSVRGQTTVTSGDCSDGDDGALRVGGFGYAGIQAEAMWLSAHRNRSLASTTRQTEAEQAQDMAEVWGSLAEEDVTLTLDDLRHETHRVLYECWDSVVAIADGLCEHGRLSRRDIARLV